MPREIQWKWQETEDTKKEMEKVDHEFRNAQEPLLPDWAFEDLRFAVSKQESSWFNVNSTASELIGMADEQIENYETRLRWYSVVIDVLFIVGWILSFIEGKAETAM